jgi:outer membrane protein TolC
MARRERIPDFTLGLEYEADRPWALSTEDSDMVFASVSLNLPIWRSLNQARIAEAAARASAAREARDGRENRLQAEWQMMAYRLRDAERRVALYSQELLPRARQSVAVARQAYEVGKAGFTDLIDTQRLALDMQMMYEQARRDRAVALAEAEMVAGGRVRRTAP